MAKTITISDETWERLKDQLGEEGEFEYYDHYVIVRTYSAGVFAGILEDREGKEVKLRKAIRLWYWDGAFTLSQLAMEGVKKPENCKFAQPVEEIILTEAIEIIPTTKKAQKSIRSVKSWKV